MAKVTIDIKDATRFNGEYELDSDVGLTALEWSWIKKFSDYYPLNIEEGFERSDPALFVSLALVALYRADKFKNNPHVIGLVHGLLNEAPYESIVWDFSDEEESDLADEARAEVDDPEAPTP